MYDDHEDCDMKDKISNKLIVAVGFVSIAVIGIFSFTISRSQQKALLAQIDHNASQLSETIKSSTKYGMLLNQREHIHRIIDTIGRQEGIEKIRVFNKEGEIIYSSVKSDIGEMVDKYAESCYACHAADQPLEKLAINERTRTFEDDQGHKVFGIINAIYNEPDCSQGDCHVHPSDQKVLGVLDVTMSLDEIDAEISKSQMKLVIFALTALVSIALILWFLVEELVGKPVRKLVQATNIVASGDLDYKIPVTSTDELGRLARSFNDMTQELAEAHRKVYQYDKLASVGRLAAGVAHEINNPLTGVLTYSSFLLKRKEKDPEVRKDLEVIVRETKRCRDIVKGLLDFARQAPPKKTQVNVNELVNQTLSILDNQLNLKNVSVKKHLDDRLPAVLADANQIEQVLINLLSNASDAFGQSGGEISVSTSTQEEDGTNYVAIGITDTGCGILQEHLTKIFEPFYSTKGQAGTGLGLSVVWGIIEEHDGKIDVESEVGKGTTFRIRLPVSNGTTLIAARQS